MKRSKNSVEYSPAGKHMARCGRCVHYRTNGTCALVEGNIDPNYWCKLFKSKGDRK